jgi:hypothetical protein
MEADGWCPADSRKLPFEVPPSVSICESGGVRRGDVLMRTLYPRPRNTDDSHNTLEAARAFHVDAVVWAYETDESFIANAADMGIGVGTAMSVQGWPDVRQLDDFQGRFATRNLLGEQVVPRHYLNFNDPYGRHMVPDMNIPEWVDFYVDYVAGLYDLDVVAVHRDDPGGNYAIVRSGGTFTDASVAFFRRYLRSHFTTAQLEELGIDDVGSFDIRAHLIQLGAPTDEGLWKWTGSPLLPIFKEAQMQATANFFRTVRERVQARTKRRIPWSCNGSGPWTAIDRVFDFRIGEFQYHFNQPRTMLELQEYARKEGKLQALISMVQRDYEEVSEFVPNTRLNIATAYALGMVPLVPWDMYMHDSPRYFGTVDDFGDLFHFVAEHRECFDTFELSGVAGFDARSRLYTWLPNKEMRLPGKEQTAGGVWIARDNVFAFVRRSSQSKSVMVHVVDWNPVTEPFELSLSPTTTLGVSSADLVLLRPGTQPSVFSNYTGGSIELPALSPWGLLVLTPAKARSCSVPAPTLLSPARAVVPSGTEARFAESGRGHIIRARYLREGCSGDVPFREPATAAEAPVIDDNGVLEAYAVDANNGTRSPVLSIRFRTFADYTADAESPSGPAVSLIDHFQVVTGTMKRREPLLGDEMMLMGQRIEHGIAVTGKSEIEVEVHPSWELFSVSVGVDDQEDRRPCARFQVWFGDTLAWETPILNPMKGMIQDAERRRFDIQLRIPEGVRTIRLVSANAGFFPKQNTVIWAHPTAHERQAGI